MTDKPEENKSKITSEDIALVTEIAARFEKKLKKKYKKLKRKVKDKK